MVVRHSTRLRGVFYGRMSNDEQEGSVEQQEEWARLVCERENVELVAMFKDEGKKGHDTGRVSFLRMLEFCREQYARGTPVDVVVCWNPNRLSRADSQETGWFIWEFRKAGVNLLLTESHGWIDFRDDTDRLVYNITQDTSNHKFLKTLASDTLRGQLKNVQNGNRNGAPPPFGYRFTYAVETLPSGREILRSRLTPDPEKAPVLQEMFRRYATGEESLQSIARMLNDRGVKPARAEKWTPPVVRAILQNEAYLGDYVWNRSTQAKFFGLVDLQLKPAAQRRTNRQVLPRDQQFRRENDHEALVDRETFDNVQRLLVENRRRKTPLVRGGDFLLVGVMRCGHCGKPMVGRRADPRGANRGNRYYCSGYNALGKQGCNFNCVEERPLADAIVRKLRDGLLNPVALAELEKELKAELQAAAPSGKAEVSRLEREAADLAAEKETAARRFLTVRGDASVVKACEETLADIVRKLEAAEKALAAAKGKRAGDTAGVDALMARAVKLMRRLDEAVKKADPPALRCVLRDLVDHVALYFEHEQKHGRTWCRFVRGTIHVHGTVPVSTTSLLGDCSGSSQASSACLIEFTAADLEAAA